MNLPGRGEQDPGAGPATPRLAAASPQRIFRLQNGLTAQCVLHKMDKRIDLPFVPGHT